VGLFGGVGLMLMMIVSTGSKSLDILLGGGVQSGLVTDFFGKSGTGKSQICFTLCVNCAHETLPGERIIFIDTTGNFRPERINEIASHKGKSNVLSKISYLRVFNSSDQVYAINRVQSMNARMIIIDNISFLISNEFSGVQMHLVLMKHLHSLSLTAIALDCAVVVTNTQRYSQTNGSFVDREFMMMSISLCTHIRAKLETLNSDRPKYRATLLHPRTSNDSYFGIAKEGIIDS
jgi:DNA repair protein RAD51